ncbi:MAG: hypothetical protein FJZ87_16600 [Chloroflexi bacterium]|nr:hypothetical protein [Chloroflexota bacterium]
MALRSGGERRPERRVAARPRIGSIACRHWVKDRMERSGMRWNLAGKKAMLNVRAIHESDC